RMSPSHSHVNPHTMQDESKTGRRGQIELSLKTRHAQMRRFRRTGIVAALGGLAVVALLFASIFAKGLPAFWQATIETEVYFAPAVIQVDERPAKQAGESPAAFRERELAWLTQLAMVNWNRIIEAALLQHVPEAGESG